MGGNLAVKDESSRHIARGVDADKIDVKIIVQPPELFVDNNAKILEVASTNNYTVAFREKNGEHGYVIYDESGKIVDPARKFPEFTITSHDIGNYLTSKTQTWLSTQAPSQNYASSTIYNIEHLCTLHNLPASAVAEMRKNLHQLYNSESYVAASTLLKGDLRIYEPPCRIYSDAQKSRFIFQLGRSLHVYSTVSKDGRVLPPAQWEYTKIRDNSSIGAEVLQKMPFLRQFMQTQKGRPLTGLDRAVDNERGILNVIDTKQNIRIFSDAAAGYCLDPNDQKTVYYLGAGGGELKRIDVKQASLTQTDVDARPLPFKAGVRDIKFDPQGNFFLIHTDENKLLILEKDTLSQAAEIGDVSGGVDVDNLGNIYFIDTSQRLRLANSNFMTFKKDGLESARSERKEKLKALADRLSNLTLPEKPEIESSSRNGALLSEEQLMRQLTARVEERFGPMVQAAKGIEDLDKLCAGIEALKSQDEFAGHGDIFLPLEEKIRERMSGMKTHDLLLGMNQLRERMAGAAGPEALAELGGALALLLKKRREVAIPDAALRRTIDGDLRELEESRRSMVNGMQDELLSALGRQYAVVKDMIQSTGSIEEITALATLPEVETFEAQLGLLADRKAAAKWRGDFRQDLKNHREALKALEREAQEEERQRIAQAAEESREILADIKSALAQEVNDTKELGRWEKGSALITSYRAKIIALPEDMRRSEEERLDILIERKRAEFEHRPSTSMLRSGREMMFGGESFPVFEEKKIFWQPKIEPIAQKSGYGYLVFEDNLGRKYRPNIGAMPNDLSDTLTREVIAIYEEGAEKFFDSLKRRVPDFNTKWVVNDYNRAILGKMARFCKIQMNEQRGILIFEGEAGTGKNVLVDMFAHFTNRETYTFSCNFQSEKEDLTYAFRFDPQKGTYRVDSKFIEMLRTPGAVLILDEINTLPPGVAKMLNPLLDYRRTLYLPDGREIKAEPSVLIVGTMNPQHYLGVKALSQEVKSRARMMYIDYPPEKTGAKFTPFEAEILAKYCDELRGLSQENFYKAWNYVVNNDQANGADVFMTDPIRTTISRLHHLVKTAGRVREAYQAFRTGRSTEIVEFVFSLRESCDVAAELRYSPDVRMAIRDVVLPKIGDPSEKERVQTIIDNV